MLWFLKKIVGENNISFALNCYRNLHSDCVIPPAEQLIPGEDCIFGGVLFIGTVFFGLLSKCCILKYFIFSTVFFGSSLFIRYFSKHSSSLISYHTSLLLNELCLRRVFLGFCFLESISWAFR